MERYSMSWSTTDQECYSGGQNVQNEQFNWFNNQYYPSQWNTGTAYFRYITWVSSFQYRPFGTKLGQMNKARLIGRHLEQDVWVGTMSKMYR